MIVSPCISICKTDPLTGYCYGCGRNNDDKKMWKDEKTSDIWKKNNLEEAVKEVSKQSGKKPRIIVTGAKKAPRSIGYEALKKEFKQGEPNILVFGTGWGLEKNLIKNADHALLPIEGSNGFNHLPVRGAISIILDRLLGNRELPVD